MISACSECIRTLNFGSNGALYHATNNDSYRKGSRSTKMSDSAFLLV